jgi:hypothetical protein
MGLGLVFEFFDQPGRNITSISKHNGGSAFHHIIIGVKVFFALFHGFTQQGVLHNLQRNIPFETKPSKSVDGFNVQIRSISQIKEIAGFQLSLSATQ